MPSATSELCWGIFALLWRASTEQRAQQNLPDVDEADRLGISSHLTGGRYLMPPDRRLCVCGSQWTPPDAWRVSWSGFVPYQ